MTTNIYLPKAVEKYVDGLVTKGQTENTVGTARRILARFTEKLGADKVVANILPVHVAGFYAAATAAKSNGKPMAKATALQIKRVVRAFLVWAQEQNYIDRLAVPGDEKEIALKKIAALENKPEDEGKTTRPAPKPGAKAARPAPKPGKKGKKMADPLARVIDWSQPAPDEAQVEPAAPVEFE